MKLETICWSYFELSDCLLLQVGVVVVVSSYADDNVLFVVNLCCDGTEEVPLLIVCVPCFMLFFQSILHLGVIKFSLTTLFDRNKKFSARYG